MKPYSEYSAEELAMEKLFIRWVRFPDDPSIRSFWTGWLSSNPNMKGTIDEAKVLVLEASNWNTDTLTNQEVNNIWERIMSSLEILTEGEGTHSSKYSKLARQAGLMLLGLVSVMLITIVLYYKLSK